MPTIPEYDAKVQLDPGSAPLPRFDTSAQEAQARQGAQLQKLGNEGIDLAGRLYMRQQQMEAFTTHVALDGWQKQVTGADQEASQKMPESGAGWADSRLKEFDKRAEAFLPTVPEGQREKVKAKLAALRESYHNNYATQEVQQTAKFSATQIDLASEGAKVRVGNNPAELELQKADIAQRIQDAPGIPEQIKPDLVRQKQRELEFIAAGKEAGASPTRAAELVGLNYEGSAKNTRLEERLRAKESTNRPGVVNQFGYSGFYQFGAPRLATLGLYQPGGDENLKNWSTTKKSEPGKWTGSFNIPGHPEVKTLQDFLSSPAAQREAFDIHVKEIDSQISAQGMDKYIGKTVGGVKITRDGIVAMAHLGGFEGAKKALEGGPNAADANGSTVLSYAKLMEGEGGGSPIRVASRATANDASAGDPRFANLTYEDRMKTVKAAEIAQAAQIQLQTQIATQQAAQAETVRKAQVDELQYRASDGKLTIEELDSKRGMFKSYEEYNSVKKQIGEGDSQWASYNGGVAKLMDPRAIWDPTSKEDKDMMSALDSKTGDLERMRNGDPKGSASIASRFAETGMVSKETKGTFEGLIRSGNPQQLETAMRTLDQMYRRNPNAFNDAMGSDITKSLHMWQNRTDQSPTAFREELKRANDPAEARAREIAETTARKTVEKMSDSDILHVFDSWPWIPGVGDPNAPMGSANAPAMGILREEFASLYAEGFASSNGNADVATKFAKDRIKQTWTVSESGGNRLMKFAPETMPENIFPTVRGEKTWMKDQVESALRTATGIEKRPFQSQTLPQFGLVADSNTRAQIDILRSGRTLPDGLKSPVWTLVYIDPKTGGPKAARFAFDLDAVQAERQKYLDEQQGKHAEALHRMEVDPAKAATLNAMQSPMEALAAGAERARQQ